MSSFFKGGLKIRSGTRNWFSTTFVEDQCFRAGVEMAVAVGVGFDQPPPAAEDFIGVGPVAPGRRRKTRVAVALDLGPPTYPRLYFYP